MTIGSYQSSFDDSGKAKRNWCFQLASIPQISRGWANPLHGLREIEDEQGPWDQPEKFGIFRLNLPRGAVRHTGGGQDQRRSSCQVVCVAGGGGNRSHLYLQAMENKHVKRELGQISRSHISIDPPETSEQHGQFCIRSSNPYCVGKAIAGGRVSR